MKKTTCIHYRGIEGGAKRERGCFKLGCAEGVDIRALVGGSDFGWMTRTPCVSSKLSRDQVSCGRKRLPTDEEIAAWEAETDKLLADHLAGAGKAVTG